MVSVNRNIVRYNKYLVVVTVVVVLSVIVIVIVISLEHSTVVSVAMCIPAYKRDNEIRCQADILTSTLTLPPLHMDLADVQLRDDVTSGHLSASPDQYPVVVSLRGSSEGIRAS